MAPSLISGPASRFAAQPLLYIGFIVSRTIRGQSSDPGSFEVRAVEFDSKESSWRYTLLLCDKIHGKFLFEELGSPSPDMLACSRHSCAQPAEVWKCPHWSWAASGSFGNYVSQDGFSCSALMKLSFLLWFPLPQISYAWMLITKLSTQDGKQVHYFSPSSGKLNNLLC